MEINQYAIKMKIKVNANSVCFDRLVITFPKIFRNVCPKSNNLSFIMSLLIMVTKKSKERWQKKNI